MQERAGVRAEALGPLPPRYPGRVARRSLRRARPGGREKIRVSLLRRFESLFRVHGLASIWGGVPVEGGLCRWPVAGRGGAGGWRGRAGGARATGCGGLVRGGAASTASLWAGQQPFMLRRSTDKGRLMQLRQLCSLRIDICGDITCGGHIFMRHLTALTELMRQATKEMTCRQIRQCCMPSLSCDI